MPCKESFAWAMIPLFEGNHAGGLSDAAYPSSPLATSLPGSTSQDSIVDPILKLTLDGKVNHYSSGSSVIVETSNLNKVKESYIVDSLQFEAFDFRMLTRSEPFSQLFHCLYVYPLTVSLSRKRNLFVRVELRKDDSDIRKPPLEVSLLNFLS
ncbi:Guanine nucleotide exchange factor SPIKE 1 [Zea mays]|uniref:Guanine nucleotide exchange factor SPIKE 1 n=1 Tax=Zea mays TaxID=4577 RepID=A0A1D6IXR5_MAIZE|nr:Guanine nucleotide exchange factor SPIKE 1 [Zea mays]